MPSFSKDEIRKAREMDLMTYLTCFEPNNLKHVSGNIYCTVEHDSLIINNGKWCWFSQGIGGVSALDYLIKVKGLPFMDAVQRLIGNPAESLPPTIKTSRDPPKEFIMPEVNSDTSKITNYLIGRGIHPDIISWCIKNKLIFETAKYANVLFVGYDKSGVPRFGAVRSTWSDYKGDVRGSDKRFAFKIVKAEHPKRVHVFESAPDLLSYATCCMLNGENWHKVSYLSLSGIGGTAVPKALEQFLKDYPDISNIYLHLDNDEPGRNATKNIMAALKDNYYVKDQPPPSGKDYNDYLKSQLAKPKQPQNVR